MGTGSYFAACFIFTEKWITTLIALEGFKPIAIRSAKARSFI